MKRVFIHTIRPFLERHSEEVQVVGGIIVSVLILWLIWTIWRCRRKIAGFFLSILGITEKESCIKCVVCRNCGTTKFPIRIRKGGSFGKFLEGVLWLILISPVGWLLSIFGFFLIPIGFTVWRNSYRYSVCQGCGGKDVIPMDSPEGKKLIKRFHAPE